MRVYSCSLKGERATRAAGGKAPLVDADWIDFALQHLDATFSLTRIRARVVGKRRETGDMTTLLLRPNRHFRGFVAGQHVPVRVVLGGIVHERCYSLTGEPDDPTLAITVKRKSSGTVSPWLVDAAAVGDVVEIGQAGGDFVLPDDPAVPLLFIAGGSGITAVASLVRAALRRRGDADVVLLYYARRIADFAFADRLAALAARHTGFRLAFLPQAADGGGGAAGRFSAAQLDAWAPDHDRRDTFLCGPEGLARAVTRHWRDAGLSNRLRREAFAPAPEDDRAARVAASVSFRRSARTVESAAPTLLAIAEGAGLRPPTGCRMGICRTCACTKLSGTVRDRVTGAIDATPGSRIRICVSEPLGPVTLDL
jgi:ferredoxin-NADP reductase